MTDLISRADAIEHLKNVKVSYPHADISLPIDLAIKSIEILPSADAVDCTDFIEWLVDRVLDETIWEYNSVAYGEIICRKLEKLGILETTEEPSYYIRPSADAEQVTGKLEHDREWIIGCIKHDGFIKTDRFDKANQIILDALSADAVQGEWIHDGQNFKGGLDWCHCSECGYKTSTNGLSVYRYCPNCGAKMVKGGDEE